MDFRAGEGGKHDPEVKYEGPFPSTDLISYKNMMMEMNHSAMTDGSCLSLVAVGLFTIGSIIVLSIIMNIIFFG